MKIKLSLTIISLLLFGNIIGQTKQKHKKRCAPIKYILHKKAFNTMVAFFDSISENKYYAIGLTTTKHEIHIKTDYRGKNLTKTLDLTDNASKKYLDSAGLDVNNVIKIKRLLEKTHTMSISNVTYGATRAIQVNLKYNLFADNCRGLTFINNEIDELVLPFDYNYKKINTMVFYSYHLGTPFYY